MYFPSGLCFSCQLNRLCVFLLRIQTVFPQTLGESPNGRLPAAQLDIEKNLLNNKRKENKENLYE